MIVWLSRENKTITHIKGIGMVIYSESNRINDEVKIYTDSKYRLGMLKHKIHLWTVKHNPLTSRTQFKIENNTCTNDHFRNQNFIVISKKWQKQDGL